MTVDLLTGQQRPHRAEDYLTKIASVAPEPDRPIPLWLAFLDRITAGDVELQRYLQRVCGYCLTGHTREHVLFFLYGTGANGKSVFTATLAGIWKDYAVTAPVEAFTESKTDRHPTELAMLRGARLVVATETEGGRYWNESRIKQLTGGERIAARFMRGDFFEFQPQFKLMVAGNNKPQLRHVDEAIRRRLHLIPFTVTIPPRERDPLLVLRLRDEWPGILSWAIGGCSEWRRLGLAPPAAVVDATDEYLASEDDISTWLSEDCEVGDALQAGSSELYDSWKFWAERSGRRGGAGSQKAFSTELERKGFTKKHMRSGAMFFGLRLRDR